MIILCKGCNRQILYGNYFFEVREWVEPLYPDPPRIYCSVECFAGKFGFVHRLETNRD